MGIEIERKFLVADDSWKDHNYLQLEIEQGYLSLDPDCVIRIRRQRDQGLLTFKDPDSVLKVRKPQDQGLLTVKGKPDGNLCRLEFEYEIPADDTSFLFHLCVGTRIKKTRYKVPHKGFIWEVDVFAGENEGLIVAEVELDSPSDNPTLPAWVGEEVSDDLRYYNSNLATNPYKSW